MMGWWQRLKDLLSRRLKRSDQSFVKEYLDDAGLFLFNQMSVVDQRHAVRVARFIIKEASFQRGIDLQSLVQAALLHDLGKIKGEISRFHRIGVGLFRRLTPNLRQSWASKDRKSAFKYALYVDLVHPIRGAYMAESFGLDPRVVSLIRRHHSPKDPGRELKMLIHADERD